LLTDFVTEQVTGRWDRSFRLLLIWRVNWTRQA